MIRGASGERAPWTSRLITSVNSQIAGARRVLSLLSKAQQRLYLIACGLYAALGFLDLAGIALTGLLAAVLASGLNQSQIPEAVTATLSLVGLGDLTRLQLSALLGVSAVVLLLLKSGAGAYLSKRLYLFLARQQATVSEGLVSDLLSCPLIFVQRWSTPQINYMVTSGAGAAVVTALGGVSSAIAELFLFLIVAIALFAFDPLLATLTAVIFGGVVVYLQFILGRRSALDASQIRNSAVDMGATVMDSLATYREAVVFNRRRYYIRRFSGHVRDNAEASADLQYVLEVPKYLLEALLVICVFTMAAVQLSTQELTEATATIALFMTAGFRLIPSLLRLQAAGTNIRQGLAAAVPTLELADALRAEQHRSPDMADEPARQIREGILNGHADFAARVCLSDVTFSYPDSPRPALVGVSLVAEPGSSIALVGSTGAGKSTLADVILGVLHPDSGSITISGLEPHNTIDRWPGAVSYVPQLVTILEGTVRENVALGLPPETVEDEWIWDALQQAHLADFLRSQREGLNTRVGERGVRLSGGQRQRLGIARALYSRPLVLVMDEATSALDAETEAAITETLGELGGKVTTITVAHRLATVRNADELLFMRDGVVVARGTFEEVRAQEPDFARHAKLLGL